jgi:hypothetical protein
VVEAGSRVVVETKTESDYRANRPMTPSTVGGAHPSERGETPMYVIISGGDGYSTKIVTEAELEDAFVGVHYGDAGASCPPEERQAYVDGLRDEDNWTMDYGARLSYHVSYEDGYVSIFRLFDSENEIAALQSALTAERAAREEVERRLEHLRWISNVNGDWSMKYSNMHERAESAEASLKEAQQQLRSEQTAVQEAQREAYEQAARVCDARVAQPPNMTAADYEAIACAKAIRALSPQATASPENPSGSSGGAS